MKKFFSIYANWRADVLFAIMAVGLVLLFAENDSIGELIATKIAAIVCGIIFSALFSKWETEGKLTELTDFIKEED